MLTILLSSVTFSFGQSANSTNVDSTFEITLINSDYSLAYSTFIVLTNRKLSIIYKGELVGEKDSLLFSTSVQQSDTLKQISNIDITQLKNYYSNDCVSDGTQITVDIKKNGFIKTVHVSNYYQEDVGKIIYLVNSLIPNKYQIWYDKKKLKAFDKLCN